MNKKRSSLTFTVFAGYLLLATLGGLAVWFVYEQVISYTDMTDRNKAGNQKLLLVGEAATKLYEAESLSRQLIQNSDLDGLSKYTAQIDSIKSLLGSLQDFEQGSFLDREIDSIDLLLSKKSQNLEELLELRASGETESYYSRVLNELQKVDETFEEPNYEQRFKDLQPHQRRLLVRLLDYAKVENPEPANITVDSLVTSVKQVLNQLEVQDRSYRQQLRSQENQLLDNEIKLNNRLRVLLSAIEADERNASLEQVENWQDTVQQTSQIIAILGAISLLVIMTFVFLVIRDVSRSQQYRRELEDAKTYAESLLKSREQFMNTVTHDLRSPLNSVVGYTGLLEKTNLSKSQNRYLDQLKRSSDYLLHLVNDLLDLSRLEAGKMSIDELTFNPKHLIQETVENAIPPEKPEEVAVRIEIDEELDQPMITDPFRIKQVLTNLVSNSCKFTEEGFVEVRAWLEKKEGQQYLEMQVKDTGIGISKEQKEKVFEEFSQENSSIEKRYGGSGLGLAISKKIVSLLKGNISLESEPGKGSTFLVEIPVRMTAGKLEGTVVSEEKIQQDLSKYKILLVDDEPAQLGLLREFVKTTGMVSFSAGNGTEALKKLEQEDVDLVLTDIQMPDMDGLQLLNHMQQKYPDIPVIALSGQPNVTPADYLKKGFSGSLMKPYSSRQLIELIEGVLEVQLQRQQQENSAILDEEKGYTLSEIKNFAGDDEEALSAILSAFIESTGSGMQALELAYQKGQKERVSAIAHKMLPMFRQLRADHLVGLLKKLEDQKTEEISSEDIQFLKKEIGQLLGKLQQEIKV
ncbi:MAG: ATP-binding protein [Salinimicrobium sp.]